MFTPIQQLLPRAMSALGVKKEIEAAIVCEKYRKVAPEILHPQILQYTYPKSYRRKILTIGIENPAWSQLIKEREKALRDAINESAGGNYVSSVRTMVVEKVKTTEE